MSIIGGGYLTVVRIKGKKMARPASDKKVDDGWEGGDRKEVNFDLTIDPDRLDRNWLDQPKLYFQYAAELADARKTLDQTKAEVDICRAEIDLAIRSDPEKYGISKITETAVATTILLQDSYKRGQNRILEAKHEVDILSAVVAALDHRKSALQNMVQLHLANYYSTPRVSGEDREAVDDMEKRAIRRGNRGNRGS